MILPGNHGWVGTTSTRLCIFFSLACIKGSGWKLWIACDACGVACFTWYGMTIYIWWSWYRGCGGWCTPASSCPSLDERTPKWRTLLEHCKRYPDIPISIDTWSSLLRHPGQFLWPSLRSVRPTGAIAILLPEISGRRRKWGRDALEFEWDPDGILMGFSWNFRVILLGFWWDFDIKHPLNGCGFKWLQICFQITH